MELVAQDLFAKFPINMIMNDVSGIGSCAEKGVSVLDPLQKKNLRMAIIWIRYYLIATNMSMFVLKAFMGIACLNQQFIHGDNELPPPPPLPPAQWATSSAQYWWNEEMPVSQPDLLFHKVFHLSESWLVGLNSLTFIYKNRCPQTYFFESRIFLWNHATFLESG